MPRLHPWLIRFIGISVLSFVTLFAFFTWVGSYNVAWALPWTKPFRLMWPDMPRFGEWTESDSAGHTQTYVQVPTRQLTKTEIKQMYYTPPYTNAAPAPAVPASAR